jgi:hypothetical protein
MFNSFSADLEQGFTVSPGEFLLGGKRTLLCFRVKTGFESGPVLNQQISQFIGTVTTKKSHDLPGLLTMYGYV